MKSEFKRNYNIEIVSPVVMSGADRSNAELRISSIKGMLRWWFRFYKSSFINLKELKELENKVFGSTEKAVLFWMRLEDVLQLTGDAYLCMNDKRSRQNEAPKDYNKIKRKAFLPHQSFQLWIKFLPNYMYISEIENSLKLLSFFGGLGSRWRRGFGSVMINEFSIEENTLDDIAKKIKDKIKDLKGTERMKSFMNFSNTKIYLIIPKSGFWSSWNSAMDDLRDKIYRPLKHHLSTFGQPINKIAYKPQYGDREVSPIVFQIKKTNDNLYYAVILIWEVWKEAQNCINFLQNTLNQSHNVLELNLS
jgi:CRISPR-associated protein Cmr1